jgi:hypothetical protein
VLLAFQRAKHGNPYMPLSMAKKMQHEEDKWRHLRKAATGAPRAVPLWRRDLSDSFRWADTMRSRARLDCSHYRYRSDRGEMLTEDLEAIFDDDITASKSRTETSLHLSLGWPTC